MRVQSASQVMPHKGRARGRVKRATGRKVPRALLNDTRGES